MNIWTHPVIDAATAWYVLTALVNSSPEPTAQMSWRTLYKWLRDTAIVLINQHRDKITATPNA